MTLTILKSTGQVICKMSLNWGLSDAFLIIIPGLWVWGRKSTEVKCYSHHTISRIHAINVTSLITVVVNLDHLAEGVFPGVSTVKLLLFLLYSLEGSRNAQPVKCGNLCPISFYGDYPRKLFGISSAQKIFYCLPFIYFSNHLFISDGLVDVYFTL